MYKVKVNGKVEHDLSYDDASSTVRIDGKESKIDAISYSGGIKHVIMDGKSYNVEVLSIDKALKKAEIKVNGSIYSIDAKDEMDQLLEKLGMDTALTAAVKDLKAPMPGLVVEIKVEPGQELAAGDPVLVLEAMKMENVLKSPADLVVDQIKVDAGNTIEKNTVLVTFK